MNKTKMPEVRNIPDITEVVVFGPDGGFNLCKAVGAKVTDCSPNNLAGIREQLCVTEFPSYWSPLIDNNKAVGRLMESPESGIVGLDAKELQPSLWTTSLGEDHYEGPIWRLYLWAMLYDILDQTDVPDNAHVKVFTSFGLPHFHMGYAAMLKELLLQGCPHFLSRRNGKSWHISFDDSLEIQSQPFWIVIDQVFQWSENGLTQHTDLLKGGLVALDFGSKTLLGIKVVNNLIPVESGHISVSIGTWDVVKEFVAPAIEKLRQQRGIAVGDIRWQALMSVYESGKLQIGKHDPLSIADVLAEYNREKVIQRLKEADTKLDGGANIANIICAGGDVHVNFDAFHAKYAENITGEFKIATDDDGNEEPLYRQMHGCLKGAVRAWAASLIQ